MTENIVLPTNVEIIINRLSDAGFDAFVVGGCVRDILMGVEPHDWDICTSALPEEVKNIFEHVVPTGEKHGTVTVILDGEGFEVTTFRIDGISSDGRHPDNVTFTRSLENDLMRRDFTINAMAFNPTVGLVDLFGGWEDICDEIIRCVGNPDERFTEDALRMMRAIRFSAQKNFRIAGDTFNAIVRNASKIENVSFERIRDEIVKVITSDNPEAFIMFHTAGLLEHFTPELDAIFGFEQNNPHHVFDVGGHTLNAMREVGTDVSFRLAVLFHDVGKVNTISTDENGISHFIGHENESADIAERVMERLHFENDVRERVVKLIRFHMAEVAPTKASVKRWMNRIGSVEEFLDVMNFKIADASAQNPADFSKSFERIQECIALAVEIRDTGEVFSKKDLAVNGFDLIEIGVPQTRRMGEIFDALVELVIDDATRNTKENLIAVAREMI